MRGQGPSAEEIHGLNSSVLRKFCFNTNLRNLKKKLDCLIWEILWEREMVEF